MFTALSIALLDEKGHSISAKNKAFSMFTVTAFSFLRTIFARALLF
jgi:hypothetical protein